MQTDFKSGCEKSMQDLRMSFVCSVNQRGEYKC